MTKKLKRRYNCFDDFPPVIKSKIKTIIKKDYDNAVSAIIPAQGMSLLQIINGPKGETEVMKCLGRMICGH